MRSFLCRRAFLASSQLRRRSTVRIPGFHTPPACAEHPRISEPTAIAAATLLSHRRSINGVPEDAPKPLPRDLAIGLTQEESGGVEEVGAEEDGLMHEFLSRFVWAMKPKLVNAFPESSKENIDEMLLALAQKVVAEMEKRGGVLPSAGFEDPSIDLSSDLWRSVWEVSKSAFEETRRTRRREDMRKFLHCDDVKEMCRFASQIGIRGNMLRELRFKWSYEKLEESEFYRNLESIRENAASAALLGEGEISTQKPTLTTLPERKGKLKYKIHDLDLSDRQWAEVADKIHESEKRIEVDEPQPIMGKCKLVTEEILNLKDDDDPVPLLAKWVELLQPKRSDWLALLGRIQEHNPGAYLKVAELVLNEDSLQTNIGDYSKLMDAYAKANRVEDAERIYQMMTERGFDADIRVLVILLQMYCDAGILDRTKEVFESLRMQGFRPDLKTYKSMIVAYVNAGLPRDAEALVREMEARNIKPTLEMYLVLLRTFAEHGTVDSAQRMFNNMQFSGIQPNLEACTLLLEAYGNAGDADQARHSFDFMLRSGHKPDDRSVASMIAAYQKNNHLDKALDLLLNLEKDGFKPGVTTYAALVDWLGKLSLVDEAEQILDKIAELGDPPFQINVSLCDMYSRLGDQAKSLDYLKRLEERKELLTAEQFERVIKGLMEGGLMEHAKRICDVMEDRGFSPSEYLRISLATRMANLTRPSTRRRPTPSR